MRAIYQLVRIACFIALPLLFQQKELTPQPIKNMLSAFIAAVIAAEIILYMRRVSAQSAIILLPLIAVCIAFFPYRIYFGYFVFHDQLLISALAVLSILYILDRKYVYPRIIR